VPKQTFGSVDDYIAALPTETQRVLERVRTIVRKAIPRAEEAIAYGIPTYRLGGRTVLHVAAWKSYCSIYPANSRVVAEFGDELEPYLAEKSTLRFPLNEPLPEKLIERIATFRANEASC
jgi:uncharacterized protein YdhG (YjbR/CyaY superfamily)